MDETGHERGNANPPSFYKRFNLEFGLEEAQRRFTNRLLNTLPVWVKAVQGLDSTILWQLSNKLGAYFTGKEDFDDYLSGDFFSCLETLEALYKVLPDELKPRLAESIAQIITESEVDLGVRWKAGIFWPSGAKFLDEALVNENLDWLADPKYANVLAPFEKGLRHLLESQKKPERLVDTVTDMYEALEAMVKVVVGKDKDLSANRELFVSKLRLSRQYSKMLVDYIDYANDYRHGTEPSKKRTNPNPNEVEAFIYTTGLFIRLAVKQLEAGG